MPIAALVANHCDQQSLTRPSGLHQHFALEQYVVFAVTAELVDKILRGTKPADIPVDRSTKTRELAEPRSCSAR
jgi:hypothetical protein